MDPTTVPRKLWEHPNPSSTAMYAFMQTINKSHSLSLRTFADLHAWSLTHRSAFWSALFSAASYIHSGSYTLVVDESLPVSAVPIWFEGVKLNFAENILFSKDGNVKREGDVAVTEIREGGREKREVAWGELRRRAGELARAMRERGVGKGDRVVCVGANSVETLCVWLGAAWLGAVFSSSSTDMGTEGILQRTGLVRPKVSEVLEGVGGGRSERGDVGMGWTDGRMDG